MNQNSPGVNQDKSPDAFVIIAGAMVEFREEMEYFNNIGDKIAAKTRMIMRIVFTILIISSIYLVFMIFQMADRMSVMTTYLEEMYGNFGSMARDMAEITTLVGSMGGNVSGMPTIAESMIHIDADVSTMRGSVYEINWNIAAIDNDMVNIHSNMQEMTGRLTNLRYAVNSMGFDVNQMSLPMNSGPLSDFWPR
jgi:methyl-accepting chemotaxis protein